MGWLVYELTGSPFLLGVSAGLRVLPTLFIGPFVGVVADRFDRRRLLLGTEACLTLLAGLFAFDVALGHVNIWHVFVFMLLSGVGTSINHVVRQALVPNLVPRGELMNAVALHSMAFHLSRILGPTLGGVLIAATGPATNFFLQSALYLGFLLLLIPIRVPVHLDTAHLINVGGGLVEGIRYTLARKTILFQLSMAGVASLIILPYTFMLPAYAQDVIHAGPEGLGLLYAAAGGGGVVGSLSLASLGSVSRMRRLLLGAGLMVGLSLALFGLSDRLTLSLLALFLVGAAQMAFNSTNNTMLQLALPDDYRGRVTALYQASFSLQAVGALVMGALAESLGVGVVQLGAGLAATLLVLGTSLLFRPASAGPRSSLKRPHGHTPG